MGTFMPVRYDQDTKAKAIRLVREHAGDYPSEYPAITAVDKFYYVNKFVFIIFRFFF